jgi:protein-disulfide isomerase|tara:strand:+ start:278 stop:451 length:174 start_codon:yes stop_codon:yes gene_type:complete
MLWGGVAIVIVAIAVVAFTVLSSDDDGIEDESLLMSGGSLIGDPNAPVTLVEFGDFQ